jgi:hypothetical protein
MKDNRFPIDAFTPKIRDYIQLLSRNNKIHENVVASSVLNACGFVLSDIYDIEVSKGWKERSNIWTVISLNSGMGKSVIMRTVYQPIIDYQSTLIEENKKHNNLVNEWRALLKACNVKSTGNYLDENPELRNWLKNHNFNDTPPDYKKQVNLFSDDFTFEKLLTMLGDNGGHSFLIRADEVGGLFKMFNRYRQGNDEETLLKLWGYDAVKRDRMNNENDSYIMLPIVSLFGATQKQMLFDMYTDDRISNGNIFRFLFTLDEELKTKNVFEEKDAYENELLSFFKTYLPKFSTEKINETLIMEEGCRETLQEWRENCKIKYVDEANVNIDRYNSIMGKMDSYIFRIAIVLNRLDSFYSTQRHVFVRNEDLLNSARIIDFYFNEIINVLNLTSIKYRKFLTDEKEIDFYENHLQPQQQYFDIIKLMELKLELTRAKADHLFLKWCEIGLLKRNSKGVVIKKV